MTRDQSRVRVLLVDDSDIVRDVSRAVLEDAGMIVDEAQDGAAAVRMAGQPDAAYGLILMDVQMPLLDGLAATRQIRALLGESAPPVVALTAHTSEQEWGVCRDAGMLDRVNKPVDPAQLLAALQRWLPQRLKSTTSVPAGNGSIQSAQALPQVPGFDLAAGLQCVSGNTELLLSMLRRFGSTADGLMAKLHRAMNADNFAEARRLAHNLKGTAATLGGQSIANVAEQLEHVVQQRCDAGTGAGSADCSALLNAIDLALAQALPALNALQAVPLPDAAARPAVMPHRLSAIEKAEVAALRELLAGNCYAARKAFAALQEKLGASDAHWQAAAAAMDTLDFQQALMQLDARYPDITQLPGASPA